MAIQIIKQIGADNDDGYVGDNLNFFYSGDDIELGLGSSYPYEITAVLRFLSVDISKGDTIDSAYLKLRTDDYYSGNNGDEIDVYVCAWDTDDADSLTGKTIGYIQLLPETSASVDWTFTPSTTPSTEHTSPDIKTVIQEIVNRNGWSNNNDITIFVVYKPGGAGDLGYFEAYDDIPSYAAKLEINYNPSADSSRNAKTTGIDTDDSSRSAVLTGQDINERDAKIHGGVEEDDAREARVRGGLDADPNERSAVILGGDMSERGATCTGTYGWYHPNWSSRKIITIDKDKVANTDQTDFPVLINLTTDSELADKAQSNGEDIVFTNNDGTVQYSHEIEEFNSTTGALVAHVKIPSLSYETDTVIYMYYGNATCDDQQDATNVWDDDFEGVWHMKDTTESKNGRSLTKKAAQEPADSTSGQMDGAQSFDGTDDYEQVAHNAGFDLATTESITIEAWVNVTNKELVAGDNYQYIVSKTNSADHSYGWDLYTQADGYLRLLLKDDDGTQIYVTDDLTLFGAGLTYVVGVRDVTNDRLRLYINGVEAIAAVTDTTTQAVTPDGGLDLGFLAQAEGAKIRFFKGIQDELRISKSTSGPRSADWLLTTFNTQSSPSTFYTLGTEEIRGSERSAVITGVAQGWSDYSDWKYQKKITIQHTKVDADLTDYPLLVNLTTDADLAAYAKSDGSDILFIDEDGTELERQIEKFDSDTGLLVAHVKCDVLDSTNVSIYMKFGNADGAETDSTDVWDTNFNAVYHMEDDPNTSTIQDSTSNNLDGTKGAAAQPTEMVGQIYKGQQADGSDDKITFGTSSLLTPAALTYEMWVYRHEDWNTAFNKTIFWAKTDGAWDSDGWYLAFDSTTHTIFVCVNGGWFSLKGSGYALNTLFPQDTWTKLTLGWDSSDDTAYIYVNGTSLTIGEKTGTALTPVTLAKSLFWNGATYNSFMKIGADEIKFSKIKRSTGYVTTMYNNEADVSTFYTLGDLSTNYYSYRGARATGGVESHRDARITGQTTGNSEREAKLTGGIIETSERDVTVHGVLITNDERDVTIHGQSTDISNQNRSARITGKDTANDAREAKTTGQVLDNNERDAHITGVSEIEIQDERDSVITGKTTDNDTREVRITGSITDNSNREAKITGKDTDNSTREANITGKDTDSDNREARITGQDSDYSSRSARITGKTFTGDRDARIHGEYIDNNTREARVTGQDTSDDFREARVHGQVTTDNERESRITGKPVISFREARIHGQDTSFVVRETRITGQITDTSDREARICGQTTGDSERDARITGKPVTSERNARITGQDTGNSERLGIVTGQDASNSERGVTSRGQDTTQDIRDARIIGQTVANSARDAIVTGNETAESYRPARITGKVSYNERSARITGKSIVNSDRLATVLGGVVTFSERDARITGGGVYSDRSAVLTGLGVSSKRNVVIRGKAEAQSERSAVITGIPFYANSERSASIKGKVVTIDERGAVLTGGAFSSERSANIVGAKCPWYQKEDITWEEKEEKDWFTKVPKKIYKESRKIVCIYDTELL